MNKYIDRLINKSINQSIQNWFKVVVFLFDPVKRQKLHTMEAASKKVKLTTSQGKLVQFQEQSDVAFTLLLKSQVQENPLTCKNFLHTH